jgi:hypothetical protein
MNGSTALKGESPADELEGAGRAVQIRAAPSPQVLAVAE